MDGYNVVIGLEVHVQLKTKSKVFCPCPTEFGSPPNTQTCPVCLGLPGSLPVLNREALKLGLRVALALNCTISKEIRFDRKNYFYPDLPKNYQISQYKQPLSQNGYLLIPLDGSHKRIGVTRVHLEEDTGKLFHESSYSLVDFNRSGIPLLEIVSEPDIASPQEAYLYLNTLKSVLRYIEVSDCNMEEGSLRCDANISVKKKGAERLGVKTEIKNMNSFKAVRAALEYEANRQMELLEGGGRVVQETRLFDSARGVTEPMRSKEDAHDYRYFPEPDLAPFSFDEDLLEEVKRGMPELPEERKKRFISEYKLSDYDASLLVAEKAMADFFESCAGLCNKPKAIANWLIGDVTAYMNENGVGVESIGLKPGHLAEMVEMIDGGIISTRVAKAVLIDIIESGKPPGVIVKEKGLQQISDAGEIETIIDAVISENPKIVSDFKSGKDNAIMALVGKVMGKTRGKANPKKVNEILVKKLKGDI